MSADIKELEAIQDRFVIWQMGSESSLTEDETELATEAYDALSYLIESLQDKKGPSKSGEENG